MSEDERRLGPSETWQQMSDFERTNWLSTRIMGWRSDRKRVPGAEFVYWFDGLKPLMLIHEWQPCMVVDHALAVACRLRNKGAYVMIVMRPESSISKTKFSCEIDDPVLQGYDYVIGDDLAEVVCRCVWLVYGQEDE